MHDLTEDVTTMARCLSEIEIENPIVHQWIMNLRDPDTILRVVLLYKMLKSQAENDRILESLK